LGLTLYALTSLSADLSKTQTFLALLLTIVPVTFAFSCIFYLTVEKPGIVLANLISTRKTATAAQIAEAINRTRADAMAQCRQRGADQK
jgi:peptidoglycan/LPS O-acetylase OafA/YrhL